MALDAAAARRRAPVERIAGRVDVLARPRAALAPAVSRSAASRAVALAFHEQRRRRFQHALGLRGRASGDRDRAAAACQRACAEARIAAASSSAADRAVGLLLRLLREAARLRPQLGEDVVDAGEIRLRFRELVLRPAAPALVAANAGDLLEQRPPLLRPQRERLVDHALADEQERVLGEVRRVEQVHEVLQPNALAVQEVVVLAGPVQAPAELDHAELDRQQAVAVVEGELHVGHADRAAASPSPPRRRPRTCGSGAPDPARRAPSAVRRRGCSCPSRSGPRSR